MTVQGEYLQLDAPPQQVEKKGFLATFFQARGATEILIITALIHFSIGSVFGFIPEVLSDRFARVYHDYTGPPCSSFPYSQKPSSCLQGSDEAQAAAASWNVITKLLSLVCNPLLGSISDVRGRRYVYILGLLLYCIPAAALLITVRVTSVHPVWFYVSTTCFGFVDIVSISFAALSDVIPPEYRAAAYGMVMASVYGGFSFAPSLALVLSSVHLAMASFLLVFLGFLVGLLALPETLAPLVPRERLDRDSIDTSAVSILQKFCTAVTRPIRDTAILNQNLRLRLVAAGSFLSAMVLAGDVTLIIYYIEQTLNVRRNDLALMFVVLGVAGIVIQGGLLQPVVRLVGERRLVVVTFLCGTLHNFLYGVAKNKSTLYVAFVISQVTKVNIALLSSLASGPKQGRIQGAISAIKALAGAMGPLIMQAIYTRTENTILGPGFMFVFASGLYAIGTVLVSFIPTLQCEEDIVASDLQQPLFLEENESDHDEILFLTNEATPFMKPDKDGDGVEAKSPLCI